MRDIFFEKIPVLLLILLPFSLITGPFIPDLSISIISIIFLLKCITEKNFNYFNNIYFKYFLIFYFVCLVSSLISDFKLISTIKSFFYIRFGIFALSVWYLLSLNQKIIKYIFLSLLFCFLLLIIDGFFQYLYGKNIIGLPKHEIRLSSFFGEELILGSYLSRLLPILIGIFFLTNYSKKNVNIYLFYSITILAIILIYLTGERTAFLLTIMSITYLTIMINQYSKNFLTISIITFFILWFVNFNNPIIKNRMVDYTKDQLGLSANIADSTRIYKGHFLIAKELFKENPILGVGPKNYGQHCNYEKKYQTAPYVCTTHPHNTYLQLLAETGITGFLMVTFLFIFFSYFSIKHIYLKVFKKINFFNFPQICLLSSMLITIWPIITSGSFFNNYLSIIYFFPVGFLLWSRKN